MIKKINIALIAAASVAVLAVSCGNERSRTPGRVYAPDMAYSRAYEFYSANPNTANGLTAQAPVSGTVARGGLLPDHIGEFDTVLAKANKYSGTFTMAEIEEAGRIYNIQCGVCHGTNLDGNGPLYNGGNGKYPAAPANFKDAKYLNMPVGTMYHAIMYGKNLMGSYASQLDAKQRWAVLAYIKKMQAENGGAPLSISFNVAEAPAEATTASAAVETKEAPKAEMKEANASATMKTESKATATIAKDAVKAVEKEVKKAAESVKEAAKTNKK
jgi:hypothetical protein